MTSLHHSVVLAIVVVTHGAVLGSVSAQSFVRPAAHDAPRDEVIATAQLLVGEAQWDESPLPDVALRAVPVDLNDLKMVQFTDPDPESLDGIVGSTSAPHLAHAQVADATEFARRAHVLPGQPRTVLLVVEVLASGATGNVSVIRGCGDQAIDVIALEYARLLRWMPGTTKHEPTTERIVFPVTLAVPT